MGFAEVVAAAVAVVDIAAAAVALVVAVVVDTVVEVSMHAGMRDLDVQDVVGIAVVMVPRVVQVEEDVGGTSASVALVVGQASDAVEGCAVAVECALVVVQELVDLVLLVRLLMLGQ
jgi:hypothetical protein